MHPTATAVPLRNAAFPFFVLTRLAALGALALPVAASAAEMTCTQLGAYLATLAPTITPYTAPGATTPLPLAQLIPAAGANVARCETNFIYSNRGGPAAGYAVGQNQRIGIRVGFPLNGADGGSGGVQGAWNGKV